MGKFKYLSTYLLACTVYISFTSFGVWTYFPLIFSFVFIPLLELFFKPNATNFSDEEKKIAKNDNYYKWVLYSIIPIQLGLVLLFLMSFQENLLFSEQIGRITSLGILCGIFGINVGHELGHRTNKFEQFLGEILLLTSLENHFLPYHNSGHHYNVATPKDPATARKGEVLYVFWFRSQIGSYFQAWQIENARLIKKGSSTISLHNKMILYTLAQMLILVSINFIFNFTTMFAFIIGAFIGILMLETVNYIEHYGLLRNKKENGNYERVQPQHSWNSNHIVGRTVLFELSRHSDHHYKASKPYQLLDSIPKSPQMITGYPGMMLLALIPPLWFKIMHKRLKEFQSSYKPY
jgi:alkane 1-monooxygenase